MPTLKEPVKEKEVCPERHPEQYVMIRPENEEEGKTSLLERLKDFCALTLAAYSLLWKPLVCLLLGSIFAYLIVYKLIMR